MASMMWAHFRERVAIVQESAIILTVTPRKEASSLPPEFSFCRIMSGYTERMRAYDSDESPLILSYSQKFWAAVVESATQSWLFSSPTKVIYDFHMIFSSRGMGEAVVWCILSPAPTSNRDCYNAQGGQWSCVGKVSPIPNLFYCIFGILSSLIITRSSNTTDQ